MIFGKKIKTLSNVNMNENFLIPLPPEDMANREQIRKFSIRGKETVRVKRNSILRRPGFNERDDFGDIPALAEAMHAGKLIPPIVVEMTKEGLCYLLDGDRRCKGYDWLAAQGHDYDYVEAVIAPKGLDDSDRLFIMLGLNNGNKHHSELEEGRIYRRLVNLGYSNAEIARRNQTSEMIVGNRLRVDALSLEEKQSIMSGELSYTAALALAKSESDPAVRKEIIAQRNDDGPLRVKDVLEQTEKKKKNKLLDSIPSSSPRDPKEEGGVDPYAPEGSSKGKLLISECLLILKAIDNECGGMGILDINCYAQGKKIGELTLKIENNLRVLNGILS